MEPLKWPEFYKPAQQKSFLGAFTRLQKENWDRVKHSVYKQLLSRPRPDLDQWGHDDCRHKVGQTLCNLVKQMYGWPNNHFIPEDPIDVVFLMPHDDLEIVEVILEFEDVFNVLPPNIHDKLEKCKLLGELTEILAIESGCP